MILTNVYHKTIKALKGKRIIGNRGGTSSSKTYSNLQLLYTIAAESRKPLTISVISETLPHLKKGAMKDFFDILKSEGVYSEKKHNKTDNIYKVGNSVIEFFSADNSDKVHGPRRDISYINECNHISWSIIEQLEIRTKYWILLDWNPTDAFWFEKEFLPREDCDLIISTYKDALNVLHPNIVKAIEMRKPVYDAKGELISGNERWWRIYGLGEVGTLDGLVFQNFAICDEMPSEHKWKSYGLDFGFTNDPSALIDVRLAHGELWLDEIIYQTGLTNQDLIQEMAHLKVDNRTEIIADSAEPKSIEEIRRGNFRIRGATKGKDSILNGINLLQGYNINITKTSLNLIKEFRNYQWQQDKHTGDYINKPIDAYCHGIDAIRYVALIKIGKRYNLGAISG